MQLLHSESSNTAQSSLFGPGLGTIHSWFSHFSQTLKQWLVVNAEIQVNSIVDYRGHIWWEVHNPKTQQYKVFISEADAIVWLDTARH